MAERLGVHCASTLKFSKRKPSDMGSPMTIQYFVDVYEKVKGLPDLGRSATGSFTSRRALGVQDTTGGTNSIVRE
jgi:hypothetical protein